VPSAKGKFIRVTVDLTPDEFRKLHYAVSQRGCAKTFYLRQAIREKLQRDKDYASRVLSVQ